MVSFKKMDEKDFVFIDKPISKQYEERFSAFRKERKQKKAVKINSKTKNKKLA